MQITKRFTWAWLGAAMLACALLLFGVPATAFADDAEIESSDPAVVVGLEDANDEATPADDEPVVPEADPSDDQPAPVEQEDAVNDGETAEEPSTPAESDSSLVALNGWVSNQYYVDGVAQTGWVVTNLMPNGSTSTTKQRFYLNASGKLVTNSLFQASLNGTTSWFKSLSDGTIIVASAYRDGSTGYVYLADSQGRLADPGWHVTDAYGQGMRRYWVDATAHACIPGYSADGWDHWTLYNGYVLIGAASWENEKMYADAAGKLYVREFLSTKDFTGSSEKLYWAKPNGQLAHGELVDAADAGYCVYASPSGAIVRGIYADTANNIVYLGDSVTGKLADVGWLLTAKYWGTYEMCYVDSIKHGAKAGVFTLDGSRYYGNVEFGMILRNGYAVVSGNLFCAGADGKEIAANKGFLGNSGVKDWQKIRNEDSGTGYLLMIDNSACKVFVFQGWAGNWVPIYAWNAGVGLPIYNEVGTPRGTFWLGQPGTAFDWGRKDAYGNPGNGPWRVPYDPVDDLRWFSAFVLDCGFHSTVGWEGGYSDPSQTGKKISHGCIRLLEENAKWIYDNCMAGTKVVSV